MAAQKEQWTIGSILKWTLQYFSEKGVDSPRLDAEVLLSHVLGRDRLYLYVHFDQPLEAQELAAFREAVKKRVRHIPVAYITGHKEFMGLDFSVTPDVLIPRPDTEILVEAALNRLKEVASPCVADLGTGSGAIIISILQKNPGVRGVAVDLSSQALAVAEINAKLHKVEDRLELRQGDFLGPLGGQVFDALLSNPPYIPGGEISALEPEVRFEPRMALDGGSDGLNFYRRMIAGGSEHLAPDGFLALEVGAGQAKGVAALADNSGVLKTEVIIKDYAGIERVVVLVHNQGDK